MDEAVCHAIPTRNWTLEQGSYVLDRGTVKWAVRLTGSGKPTQVSSEKPLFLLTLHQATCFLITSILDSSWLCSWYFVPALPVKNFGWNLESLLLATAMFLF